MTDETNTEAAIIAFDNEAIGAAFRAAFHDANGNPSPLVIKVGKGDSAIEVAFDNLPAASMVHAMRRGLQEDLNNAKAGLGDDPAKAKERIDAVAEKYRTADFSRKTGERDGVTDDVETVAKRLCRESVARMIAQAKKANPAYSVTKEQKQAAFDAVWAQNEKALRKQAETEIAARKGLAEGMLNKEGSDALAALGITPAA